MKVFWSWQSDTPQATGRQFVRAALDAAVAQLAAGSGLEDAERPEVDSDTSSVPGSPPIAETILRKIRECAVFVADVTPVGRTAAGKKLVNPNVMIELGYAVATVGHERVVLVMNQAEGASLRALPFDLRHWRGPISYSLSKAATVDQHATVLASLVEDLTERLGPSLAHATSRRPSVSVAQGTPADDVDPAVWSGARPKVRVRSVMGESLDLPVVDGPKLFVRIIPAGPFDATRADMVGLHGDGGYPLRPLGEYGTEWNGASAEGAVAWNWDPRIPQLRALTQWFQSTGEIWGIWPDALIPWHDDQVFTDAHAARGLERFLTHHFATLSRLSARLPWQIIVGVRGLGGSVLPGSPYHRGGRTALADQTTLETRVTEWGPATVRAISFAFLRKVHDVYGAPNLTESSYEAILRRTD